MPRRLVAVALFFAACGSSLDVPPYVPEDYASRFVQLNPCLQGAHPRKDHVIAWINPEAAAAWRERKVPFPVGTTIIKAQYSDAKCTDLARFTAMRKEAPGTAPASADWGWQLLDDGRGVRECCQNKGCIDCHSVCDAEDFICTGPAAPGPPPETAPVDDGFGDAGAGGRRLVLKLPQGDVGPCQR